MSSERNYEVLQGDNKSLIKAWVRGVPMDEKAKRQLRNLASLPFIHKWVAAMPDVHVGIGATVGSVVPTKEAIIPAAVGVDLGCGMMAQRTSLSASDLPDTLKPLRLSIEQAVPHGRSSGGRRRADKGSWSELPKPVAKLWNSELDDRFRTICKKHPAIAKSNSAIHLGTLGTGNHFIELCLDKEDRVWVMLHSGSRGVGNKIGTYFIQKAREEMRRWQINLPDRDLAYLPEGSRYFDDYVDAVGWAQDFARHNREVMMAATLDALREHVKPFTLTDTAVNCHHNYVEKEHHYGENVWVTRKGAVRARKGDLGIIPGSMGARSFIVRGLGNPESFHSCSHGAGRVMSRTEAKKTVSLAEHKKAVAHVECRTDPGVIDETPSAYKPIEKVMAAQSDLVEIVYELRQVVCVKG